MKLRLTPGYIYISYEAVKLIKCTSNNAFFKKRLVQLVCSMLLFLALKQGFVHCRMENLEHMFRLGLYINDLSIHDSSRELVLANTQQSAELKLMLDQVRFNGFWDIFIRIVVHGFSEISTSESQIKKSMHKVLELPGELRVCNRCIALLTVWWLRS